MTFGTSLVFCACEARYLLSLLFSVFRTVHNLTFNLVTNKNLRYAVIETHIFDWLYVFFPDHRRDT
jgi:hypothetical protein